MASPSAAIHAPRDLEEAQSKYGYSLVIPNKTGDHVLATVSPTQVLELPSIWSPDTLPSDNTLGEWLQTQVAAHFGILVHFVRYVSWGLRELSYNENMFDASGCHVDIMRDASGCPRAHILILLDIVHDYPNLRQPLRWIPRDIALNSEWVQLRKGRDVADCVAYVFEERNGQRQWNTSHPWESAGWFTYITEWVNGVLEANNMVMESPMLKDVGTTLSQVLTCTVKSKCNQASQWKHAREVLYTKTSLPVLREGERTAAISRVIGAIAPEVLAVHEGDGTILMRDAGAVSNEALQEESLIDTILEMQRISMNRVEELKAGSLMVVDSEWVESNIEWILNHEGVNELWADEDGEIDTALKETVEELRSKVGTIQEACRKLARYKLPKTLVHGDLGFHNIGSRKKGKGGMYCFFDWEKAFIGNPAYDLHQVATNVWLDGRSRPINKKNVDSLFRKQWMPGASDGDIKFVFNTTQAMFHVHEVYELIWQYESYGSLRANDAHMSMGDAVMWLCESLAGLEEDVTPLEF